MAELLTMGIPVCPITQEPINEPVIDPDGNSYEKSAIIEWVRKNNTSPITRNNLKESDLTPNRALSDMIMALTINQNINENNNQNQNNNQNNNKIQKNCFICNKVIFVSSSYKGKKAATCYNCRISA